MRRLLILAGFLVIVPGFTRAQHHGGTVAAGQAVVAAPHVAGGVAPHGTVRVATPARVAPSSVGIHRNRAGGSVNHNMNGASSGTGNLPAFSTDFADSPGLGFDFAHLAAVSNGRQRHERFEESIPFGFSGFLLSSPGMIVEEAQPVENPQPAAEEMAAANGAESENRRGSETRNLYGTVSVPAPAPQHDAPEYVFVRRDGGLVFAVAYSWENGTLRYITRDGLRGSVKQGALDMEATQQFNEQRGVDFRLPA